MLTTPPFKNHQNICHLKQCSGELHACLLTVTQTPEIGVFLQLSVGVNFVCVTVNRDRHSVQQLIIL